MYTIKDICEKTGRSRLTIYRWINLGKLKAVKNGRGRKTYVEESEFERFIQNETTIWKTKLTPEKPKEDPRMAGLIFSLKELDQLEMYIRVRKTEILREIEALR